MPDLHVLPHVYTLQCNASLDRTHLASGMLCQTEVHLLRTGMSVHTIMHCTLLSNGQHTPCVLLLNMSKTAALHCMAWTRRFTG